MDLVPQVNNCQECALRKNSKPIPGEGPIPTDIMIIGLAPGYEEIKQNKLFVGPSGQKLNSTLQEIGLNRDQIYITNIVKCANTPGRKLSKTFIKKCSSLWLTKEIELVQPKVILALGQDASSFFGKKFVVNSYFYNNNYNCWIVVTHHPARLLRTYNDKLHQELKMAFIIAKNLLHQSNSSVIKSNAQYIESISIDALNRLGTLVAIDLETTGLNFLTDSIRAVGISNGNTSIGFPFNEQNKKVFQEWYRDKSFILHNAKFDYKFLKKEDIKIAVRFDTKLAHSVIDRDSPNGLSELALKYLHTKLTKGTIDFDDAGYSNIDAKQLSIYAANDAFMTYKIYEILKPMIDAEYKFVYYNITIPTMLWLADAEFRGIKVDREEIKKELAYMKFKLKSIESDINNHPVVKSYLDKKGLNNLNLRSPKQLSELLYKRLQLQCNDKNTSEATLEYLSEKYPQYTFIKLIVEYRHYFKGFRTYLENLLKFSEVDGRVHPDYSQTRTSTSRLACRSPNLQNIPKSAEISKIIRKCFVATEGYVLMQADFSQAEFRCLGHYSKCSNLIRLINEKKDIHRMLASLAYGKAESEISDNERTIAKCVTGDTYVYTDQGSIQIKRLFPRNVKPDCCYNSDILVADKDGELKPVKLLYYNGVQNTIKIKTTGQFTLEGSENHKVMTTRGLISLKDIQVGDKVLITFPRASNQYQYVTFNFWTHGIENKDQYSSESPTIKIGELWGNFIGLYQGDGSISGRQLSFYQGVKDYKDVHERYNEILAKLGFKYHSTIEKNTYKTSVNYIILKRFLTKLGVIDLNGKKAFRVPTVIRKSPLSVMAKYLQGLFDTDGWVTEGQIGFCTKHELFAKEIQQLLLYFHICASLHKQWNSKYRRYYYIITITNKQEMCYFYKFINFSAKKKRAKLEKIISNYIKKFKDKPINKFKVVKVISIEKSRNELYDLELCTDDHLYLTNGFISHNTITFGIMYGRGAKSIAEQFGISIEEAQKIRNLFFETFPEATRWMQKAKKFAKKYGFVKTLTGRKLPLPKIFSKNEEEAAYAGRCSVNYPIQSTVADMTNLAGALIHHEFKKQGLDAYLLLNIHDALVIECHKSAVDKVKELVMDIMKNKVKEILKLRVDLDVDVKIGKTLNLE